MSAPGGTPLVLQLTKGEWALGPAAGVFGLEIRASSADPVRLSQLCITTDRIVLAIEGGADLLSLRLFLVAPDGRAAGNVMFPAPTTATLETGWDVVNVFGTSSFTIQTEPAQS